MISTLNRNGLVERLVVTGRHRSKAVLYPHSRYVGVSRRPHPTPLWTVGFQTRFIVTQKPPATEPTPKDLPPPIPAATRKPKVELRPGPIKPPKASEPAPPTAPSAPTITVAPSEAEAEKGGAAASSSTASQASSVVEQAKEDYAEASKHGILAPPPEGASWPRKLYHQAKEIFKFYVNGVKLINTNRKRTRELQARVKAGGPPLTRWETRFIATYKQDALKLIPFALIVLIAEEVIPLVVIYAPFILPSTCLLPSQKERIDRKRRDKQKSYAVSMQSVFASIHSRAAETPGLAVSDILDRAAVVSYNGVLSLSTFGLPSMRLRRLKRYIQDIAADDALLAQENHGARLSQSDLQDALEERGILADNLAVDVMRERLRWWLSHATQAGVTDPFGQRLLLVARSATGNF